MDDVGDLEWWQRRAQWLSERSVALNLDNTRLRAAITTADLQIGDGHIESARQTLHAAMDSPALARPAGDQT